MPLQPKPCVFQSISIHSTFKAFNQNFWCFYIFLKPAMTHIKYYFFLVFLFTLLTNTLKDDNFDIVSWE